MPAAGEQHTVAPRADAPTPVLRRWGALFGITGTVLCLLTLWRGWPPVVWWVGSAAVGLGLILLAWWRHQDHRAGRRAAWIAVALVVALAVAAVPVLAPVLRPAVDVAWSIEGSEEPVAEAELPEADTASVILTVDAERVLRARQAEDGTVLWQHHAPNLDLSADTPARVAGTVVLVGAGALVDPAEEAVALDLATGAELWSVPANDTPLVHNGSALVLGAEEPGGDRIYRGMDLTTGDVMWSADRTGLGWQSVPAGTSESVVPFSEWLVADIGQTRHQVIEVATGAPHLVGDRTTYASAGIVDGYLIVQDVLVDPDEVTYGSEIPSRVTAYDLPGGEVAWEAAFDLSHSEWRTFSDRRSRLATFDGVLLSGSGTEGALDVLDLRDGELTTFERAEEVPRIRWAHEDTAIASIGLSSLVLDLAGQQVTEVRRDERAVEGAMTTIRLDGVAAPAWQAAAEGLFGREYSHLVAFELADVTAPEQTDLGALPDGVVQGSYAGRVVVMEWELLPDAPDEQRGYRYTAMHVLAPFD